MSNKSADSHAAALAAFQSLSLKKPEQPPPSKNSRSSTMTVKKKQTIKLSIDTKTVPLTKKPATSTITGTKITPENSATTPTNPYRTRVFKQSATPPSANPLLKAASLAATRRQETVTPNNRSPPKTFRDSSRSIDDSGSSKTTPVSLSAALQSLPYFPGFESSPESNITYKIAPRPKRLSGSTSAEEMLSRVRQSINAKTKTTVPAEVNDKNQAAISGVRESIDLKRISTTVSNLQLPFSEDSYNRRSSSSLLSQSSGEVAAPNHPVYDKEIFHNSYSYLGSSLLENGPIASSETPAIVISNDFFTSDKEQADQNLYKYGYESGEGDDEGERDEDQSEDDNFGDNESGSHLITPQPRESTLEQNPSTPVGNLREYTPEINLPTSDTRSLEDIQYKEQKELTPENKTSTTLTRKAPPITIPPSLNAYARSVNAGSAESLVQPVAKPKLSRKPPPEFKSPASGNLDPDDEDDETISTISAESNTPKNKSPKKVSASTDLSYLSDTENLSTSESTRVSNEYEFFYTDGQLHDLMRTKDNNPDKIKFPQFPDIDTTYKKMHLENKHHIFKKRPKIKGVDSSVNLLELDTESEIYGFTELGASKSSLNLPSRPTTPVVKAKPVQLKTTMRPTNKRKERKLQFNENKPWKNHNALKYITEQERKRYEGVWVSNKGSYMNHLVTKLNGVNYEKQEKKEENLIEEEISTKAARLSSKYRAVEENDLVDINKLHDLENADISQLMLGVVVKRIWERSRLPPQTLELIWNLVDFRQDGSLNRVEFLVGMWLIDQCLYGRKLPKKVEDTVWESLGYIGLDVIIKKKGRR